MMKLLHTLERIVYSFTGCIRGFTGYVKEKSRDVFSFAETRAVLHKAAATVENLKYRVFI